MGIMVEDGRGTGSLVRVSSDFRFNVSARANNRSYYVSRDTGSAFSMVSHDATAAAGTFIFYFKNISTTQDFFVEFMSAGGVASILWKTFIVTGTAAGGSVITATNLNRTSTKTAAATVRGDDAITGLTPGVEISTMRSPANSQVAMDFQDTLIIPQGIAFAVEADAVSSTDVAQIFFRGFYE